MEILKSSDINAIQQFLANMENPKTNPQVSTMNSGASSIGGPIISKNCGVQNESGSKFCSGCSSAL
ncbi:MAG: hypothetical protein RBG13Loki_1163 [Promethearchaeota archaeon CR_4]|nr:MAG: hypothetical protein RBG13Loki_1163 [Candidatus Lokiarchaeota archaeon CR_4]